MDPVITKTMIGQLLRTYPIILDHIDSPFKECAVAYYINGVKVADLEEISNHLMEGFTIVKRIRSSIINIAICLFLDKI